jgi:hypothetical protein
LNPAIVVLGGSVAESAEILLASAREAIYRQAHPLATRDLRIVRSQMGASAALVGAARVVTEEVFSPPTLQRWIAGGSPRRDPAFIAFVEVAKTRRRGERASQPYKVGGA